MSHFLLAAAITIIVLAIAVYLLGGTNAAVWALNRYARTRGGEWRQATFMCPGCGHLRHIARTDLIGQTSCVHCAPAPAQGGTR